LQQVGTRTATLGAVPVSPDRLPAPLREASRRIAPRNPVQRALVRFGHTWVLHRRRVLQAVAAVCALAVAGGIYQVREPIASGVLALADLAQGKFADTPFGVSEISLTGQTITREQDIVETLGLNDLSSTLNFDVAEARARLEELPAVREASVRKVYPGKLEVDLVERVPIARWVLDGVTFVIDDQGNQLGDASVYYTDLPTIIGDGAADDALPMIRTLDQYPQLKDGLMALSRIADRRWDMIYQTGLRVQLPEHGVAQALQSLLAYQRDYQLMERDLDRIDLRVPGMVALRVTDRQAETTAEVKTTP